MGKKSAVIPRGVPRGIRPRVFPALAVAIIAVTLLVYAGVMRHPFLFFDDDRYVTGNPHVRAGLTKAGAVWAFKTFRAANWHPLTWLSHMLDVELFGLRPAGHHLVNAVFHAANAALLLTLLLRMMGGPWRSAFVAGLFALHPLHVESVAWVAERKDVLSTFFGLGALLAYVRHAERPGPGRLSMVALLFALSLLAKPMLVTLPFLLLLLDWWPLERLPAARAQPFRAAPRFPGRSASTLLLEKTPLFLVAAAASVAAWMAQNSEGAISSAEAYPLAGRLANGALSYVAYLGQALWPAGLAVFYPHPGQNLPWTRVGAALLLLAGLTALAFQQRGARPHLLTGWLWFLGTLVPVIGIVQLAGQARADRYTYLPLVGIFLALVWEFAGQIRRRPVPRWVIGVGGGIVLSALALATRMQLGFWTDTASLFSHAAAAVPGNWFAEAGIAVDLGRQGRVAEAVTHYERALRLRPVFAEAHMNFGVTLQALGRLDEALDHLEEALRLRPDLADIRYNLGSALQDKGNPEEARVRYTEALRIDPEHARSLSNLGAIAAREGRSSEAVAFWERAVAADPGLAEAHYNLGITLGPAGRVEEAIAHLQEAARLRPADPEIRRSLATGYGVQGSTRAAISELREVLRLSPGDPAATAQLEALLRAETAIP